jgi:gamma-glutamyltranspeptidase/glutathione hydrolase
VSGAAYAVKTYGTKPLAEVLAPAIEIADNGFPITERSRRAAERQGQARQVPVVHQALVQDGKPLAMGDIMRNPDLARTLRAIAAQGPDAFYKGDIAKNTAAFLKANGGIITEADPRGVQAFEDAPITSNYRGVEVYECRPTRRAS